MSTSAGTNEDTVRLSATALSRLLVESDEGRDDETPLFAYRFESLAGDGPPDGDWISSARRRAVERA
jgi:hypothetical protein